MDCPEDKIAGAAPHSAISDHVALLDFAGFVITASEPQKAFSAHLTTINPQRCGEPSWSSRQVAQPLDLTILLHDQDAWRAFERRFSLANHMKVTDAKLDNGMLHVDSSGRGLRNLAVALATFVSSPLSNLASGGLAVSSNANWQMHDESRQIGWDLRRN